MTIEGHDKETLSLWPFAVLVKTMQMTDHLKKYFVYILVAVALITSTASPACKFISGQSGFIEICSGTELKRIPAPDGYETTQTPAKEDTRKKERVCEFCFAQAHFGKNIPQLFVLPTAPSQHFMVIVAWHQKTRDPYELHWFSARAPPAFI